LAVWQGFYLGPGCAEVYLPQSLDLVMYRLKQASELIGIFLFLS
jgi:hypothetical protein